MLPTLWPAVHRLATGADWPPASAEGARLFVERAMQESLLPLLAAERELPDSVRAAMTGMAAMLAAQRLRTRVIGTALSEVAELLGDEPFMILKGCDFAYRLYPSPELRPMADIDILVREHRMQRVAADLERRGMQRTYPAGAASRLGSHHEASFSIGNVTFEVHHRFIQKARHRIDYAAIWDRAVPLETPYFRALRLGDADAVAYQTLSIAIKYFTSPLIRYVDLWLLLQGREELLGEAARIAADWRARHAFYAALRHATRLFPDFRSDAMERALGSVCSARTRAFLDERVIPQIEAGKKRIPPRSAQLWQKYWLMDNLGRRSWFALYHAAASLIGRAIE